MPLAEISTNKIFPHNAIHWDNTIHTQHEYSTKSHDDQGQLGFLLVEKANLSQMHKNTRQDLACENAPQNGYCTSYLQSDLTKHLTDSPLHLILKICDCMALPLLLLDQDARIVWRNQHARSQTPFLLDRDGANTTISILQRRLQHHIRMAASWPTDRIEAVVDAASDLVLELVRIIANDAFFVLVRPMQKEAAVTPTPQLRLEKFGLTPTERLIAEQLLSGRTTTEIAKANAISLQTVRTHIKHVYSKLGIHCREKLTLRIQSS